MEKGSRLTLEDIINKFSETYMSIIFLTIHFQKNIEGGLRLLHYRYALVIKRDIKPDGINYMRKFFGRKLKHFYYTGEIKRCITTRQNLVKKLNNLIDMDLLEIKPDKNKRNPPIYRINQEQYNKIDLKIRKMLLKKKFLNMIEGCSEEILSKIEKSLDDYIEIRNSELESISKDGTSKFAKT